MKNWKALNEKTTLVIPYKEGESFRAVLLEKLGCEVNVNCEVGAITTVFTLQKLPMEKILFVGVGQGQYKEAFQKAGCEIHEDIAVYVEKEYAFDLVLGLYMGMYSYKEKEEIHVSFSGCEMEVNKAQTLAACVNEAKYWADMPSNLLTPVALKDEAVRIAKENNLEIEVLSNEQLTQMGAGGILAVNAGSKYPCFMVSVKYNGNGDAPYLALVGKGLTYDAGGYSIKKNMMGMKYDMCGAANVLATIDYVSKMKYKMNVMAIIGTTENMVDANSYTVDHVISMLNNMSVEITNTDAEGRLVLADCITYAQKSNVCHIIDMATLTGACANAIGTRYTGAFTNNEEFLSALKQASQQTNEKIWQMPLDEDFHKQIHNSSVADVTNCQPGEKAGASLAAAFLEEFVENNTPWIHLDIAGTSLYNKVGTGVMIQTLAAFIEMASK